jgi:hypothetical protein
MRQEDPAAKESRIPFALGEQTRFLPPEGAIPCAVHGKGTPQDSDASWGHEPEKAARGAPASWSAAALCRFPIDCSLVLGHPGHHGKPLRKRQRAGALQNLAAPRTVRGKNAANGVPMADNDARDAG